jgi:hypothetical protein
MKKFEPPWTMSHSSSSWQLASTHGEAADGRQRDDKLEGHVVGQTHSVILSNCSVQAMAKPVICHAMVMSRVMVRLYGSIMVYGGAMVRIKAAPMSINQKVEWAGHGWAGTVRSRFQQGWIYVGPALPTTTTVLSVSAGCQARCPSYVRGDAMPAPAPGSMLYAVQVPFVWLPVNDTDDRQGQDNGDDARSSCSRSTGTGILSFVAVGLCGLSTLDGSSVCPVVFYRAVGERWETKEIDRGQPVSQARSL